MLKQAQHLTFVVLARGEPSLVGGLQQLRIRTAIPNGVRNRIARLARRKQLSPGDISRPRAEFQAIQKLRFQQDRFEHLPQTFRIPGETDGGAGQRQILCRFRRSGLAPKHAVKLLADGLRHFTIRRRGLFENDRLKLRRRQSWSPLVFRIRKILRPDLAVFHARRTDLLRRDPLRIREHHQQVTAIEHRVVVVANA